jgi:hypothetical protein
MAMATLLTERYDDKIHGVLSCLDRVIITGMIPQIGYADAMSCELYKRKVRVFDYTQFVQPMREEIRQNAEVLARENGLEIEFIRRNNFDKGKRIKGIIRERGDHPGLVHIFSAMESCMSYKPWRNKKGISSLKVCSGKCLHYYFYFIDERLGLCYMRVPTWAPFRIMFYFNGHNQLAIKMKESGVDFTMVDNAFFEVEDFKLAQDLANQLNVGALRRSLDKMARRYCPAIRHFRSGYHWSLMQVEYATDIVFRSRDDLRPLYEVLSRTAIHAVKARDIVTFLGRRYTNRFKCEIGNNFHTRVEGTRIKHQVDRNRASIKMYDKQGSVLRIETTVNDVSFFKHHRRVEHRDGSWSMQNAPVRKTIFSLPDLRHLMGASNRRYLEFLSDLDDPTVGFKDLLKISERRRDQGDRSYKGFNLFEEGDLDLFEAIVAGEFVISGFRNRNLRDLMPGKTSGQISRVLKRLRLHGLVKKIGKTYKYYLTKLGRRVVTLALKLRRLYVIPALAHS